MKRVVGIARGRAGRAGLVAGVMVAAVIGLSGPAGANTGHVVTAQDCQTWSVSVTLDNNVTSDHFVEITTTIPGTTGMVDGHYNTIGNQGPTQIWSASGAAPTSGTVTLTILNPNKSHDSQSSQSLPGASGCSTTTTDATTTTTAHDNRCDANHPNEGNDDNGHNNPDCDTTTTTYVTTTTYPETTTTTHHECGCSTTTTEVTTTTYPHCECTTTTTQPVTTTTEAESTTTTQPVTTTTSKIRELGSTTIVTTTTHPKASTTLADASTVAPTTTPTAGLLPHTGSSTTFPVIFGGMCLAAGAALALRKRSAWSRP